MQDQEANLDHLDQKWEPIASDSVLQPTTSSSKHFYLHRGTLEDLALAIQDQEDLRYKNLTHLMFLKLGSRTFIYFKTFLLISRVKRERKAILDLVAAEESVVKKVDLEIKDVQENQ